MDINFDFLPARVEELIFGPKLLKMSDNLAVSIKYEKNSGQLPPVIGIMDLPDELICEIICQSGTSSSILGLICSCRRIYNIWMKGRNLFPIYKHYSNISGLGLKLLVSPKNEDILIFSGKIMFGMIVIEYSDGENIRDILNVLSNYCKINLDDLQKNVSTILVEIEFTKMTFYNYKECLHIRKGFQLLDWFNNYRDTLPLIQSKYSLVINHRKYSLRPIPRSEGMKSYFEFLRFIYPW